MKKTFKTLATFLLLFTLITGVTPVQPSSDSNTEPEISICGDDDENDYEIIGAE